MTDSSSALAADASWRHRMPFALGGGLLLLLTILAYIPAYGAGYIWDDPRYVTSNDLLLSVEGLKRIWFDLGATVQYYPMVFTTFWIEHKIWGLDPAGFHVVNVVLHALSSIGLFAILRRLGLPGAWLAAALFALHPVNVESVAWVTERKNVLSGFFYMLAALAYLRFDPASFRSSAAPDDASAARRWVWYGAALVLFAGALLSKTVTCSLPAALAVVMWWKRGRLSVAMLLPLVPLFALGLLGAWNTAHLEATNVGAEGADWSFTLVDRLFIATRAPWFYLGKLVFPVGLAFNYTRWALDSSDVVQWIFPVLTVGTIAACWFLRHRIGRGPLAAILFFGGTLVPALGFVDTYPMRYSYVADHFQYLATIGPLAFAAALLCRRRGEDDDPIARRAGLGGALGALAILVLAVLTFRHAAVYESRQTLWEDTIAKNPESFLAHNNLADVYDKAGRRDDALRHLRRALEIKEDFPEAHTTLGGMLISSTLPPEIQRGITHCQRAVELRPDSHNGHANLARGYMKQQRFDDALRHADRAVELNPDSIRVRRVRVNVLILKGDIPEAIAELRRGLELDPSDAPSHHQLAGMLATTQGIDAGLAQYAVGIERNPDSVMLHMQRATMLTRANRLDEAIAGFRDVVRLAPSNGNASCNLGLLLLQQGKRDDAIAAFRAALAAEPNHARATQELRKLELTP